MSCRRGVSHVIHLSWGGVSDLIQVHASPRGRQFLQIQRQVHRIPLIAVDANISERNSRRRVIEEVLDDREVRAALIGVVAERFAQGMRANRIGNPDRARGVVQNLPGCLSTNRAAPFLRGEERLRKRRRGTGRQIFRERFLDAGSRGTLCGIRFRATLSLHGSVANARSSGGCRESRFIPPWPDRPNRQAYGRSQWEQEFTNFSRFGCARNIRIVRCP